MTNNNDSDDLDAREEIIEHIQSAVEGRTLSAEELEELLQGIRDDEGAVWIVERQYSAFRGDQLAVYDDRVDAVEHALRLAKRESEGSGEEFDVGIVHERKLLIGTEHVYELFVCGDEQWRVVRGLPDAGKVPCPDSINDDEDDGE